MSNMSYCRFENTMSTETTKPILELTGSDGNAMMILGKAQRVAKKAGWSSEKRTKVFAEATSGDYDHVLQTMMKYFEVE